MTRSPPLYLHTGVTGVSESQGTKYCTMYILRNTVYSTWYNITYLHAHATQAAWCLLLQPSSPKVGHPADPHRAGGKGPVQCAPVCGEWGHTVGGHIGRGGILHRAGEKAGAMSE